MGAFVGIQSDRKIEFVLSELYASQDQHTIPVAEKAIARIHRLFVCVKYQIPARKRTHQHQKRRFRKVKIRQQRIDCLQLIGRVNEDLSLAFSRFQLA